MDPTQPPAPKQRSPWVYVLLGCAGFAGLTCLGIFATCGYVAKKGNDMIQGVTDPKQREENARRSLGGIPEGYYVAASLSVFGMMETTMLTDVPPLADGGFAIDKRSFMFFHVMGTEQNKRTKAFFTSDSNDTAALRQSGINMDAKDIIKRGQLTVDSRKFYYVVTRGRLDTGGMSVEGLNNAIYFECPGDALNIGVWSQRDDQPDKKIDELNLTGTVADELAIAKFVKPMDPCGK